jgi:hypothetical protein
MAEKVGDVKINVDGISFNVVKCLSLSGDLVDMIKAYSGGKYNYMKSRMGVAIRDSDYNFLESPFGSEALSKLHNYHFLHDRFAYVMGISDNLLYSEDTNKHSNGLLFQYSCSLNLKKEFPYNCKFRVYYKEPYLMFEYEKYLSQFSYGYGAFLIECCVK